MLKIFHNPLKNLFCVRPNLHSPLFSSLVNASNEAVRCKRPIQAWGCWQRTAQNGNCQRQICMCLIEHTTKESLKRSGKLAFQSPELDKLYKKIIVEVRGHDRAVLNSYEYFAKTAASELNVDITRIWEPREDRYRRTLLKSVFIYKKHRVQYEFRTYFRLFELKHLTGSTADTYLEYIQRNLPEGVAMKVTKHQIEKLPEHIENYVPVKNSTASISDKSS